MKKNELTFYFKKESVVMEYHNQFISFNCYAMQSHKKFKDFKTELSESKPKEFNNLNDIYGLASKHGIRASAGHKPTMTDTIAF